MRTIYLLLTVLVFIHPAVSFAQADTASPKGSLFIIGGGDRPPGLMQQMVAVAGLLPADHIVILPMSSAEPDTSFYYIREDLQPVCRNTIANLNFTSANDHNPVWLDSLRNAKLIFITGGDQVRFMKAVLHTPVYEAIHTAYRNGATIAGTSAGAAVMSQFMITGNQLQDTVYAGTFDKLWSNNIELQEGLGLITTAIVDQHFVVRSRYNRLLSALAQNPGLICIGVDEATAIIIHKTHVTVAGESQVVVMKNPEGLTATSRGLIKFRDISFSIYSAGDGFELR